MAARWTAVLVMLAAFGPATAQNSGKTVQEELARKLELFQLCTLEARMDLLLNPLPDHVARTGLTGNAVREVVESRLRRARVFNPNAGPLLQALFVLGEPEDGHIPFYSIELAFLRDLVAQRLGLSALAETWSTGGAGQGDVSAFLDHLGALVDTFVAEYLRVQGSDDCVEARRPRPTSSGVEVRERQTGQ